MFELERDLLRQFNRCFAVKVWKKFPIKKFKPQIDEKKEPEFDIEHKEEMVGFAIISLQKLKDDINLNQIQEKYPIFEYDSSSLRHYNVFWPHKDELKRVEQAKEEIEKERQAKYSKKNEEEDAVKKDPKAKKPDLKKKKPAATGGKKVQEEEVKLEQLGWPLNTRKVIAYQRDEIAKEGLDNYSAKETQYFVSGNSSLAVSIKIF